MVRTTAKSTYFKELMFSFFQIFYTLIVHYVINFVLSIGKQPYREVHVVYSYNDINYTYLYMRTNYLRDLANIVHILWSRPVWGGGGNSQLNWLTCCKHQKKCNNFAVADKHDAVLEVIDGQAIGLL